jgi:hypothetical protein
LQGSSFPSLVQESSLECRSRLHSGLGRTNRRWPRRYRSRMAHRPCSCNSSAFRFSVSVIRPMKCPRESDLTLIQILAHAGQQRLPRAWRWGRGLLFPMPCVRLENGTRPQVLRRPAHRIGGHHCDPGQHTGPFCGFFLATSGYTFSQFSD